jgi:hypothetical protein
MATALLIYLIGCLFGFGIVNSFITAGYYEDKELSNNRIRLYGTVLSWLTVAALLLGILKGLMKGVDEDED